MVSPHALRVRAMWSVMRDRVLAIFSPEPGHPANAADVIQKINDIYRHDAYNSLSIEGFDVTEGLIERVRSGAWDPIGNERDSETRNALAAKGYADAFKLVVESVSRVFHGEQPGKVAEADLHGWYTALFGPSVRAGIKAAVDLAGYRNAQVYIRGANHFPPNAARVSGMTEELFALLKEEKSAAVRAVLGHLIFVHIHPFMDGNGRTARFLMNLMFVSGGFPWTIVRAEKPRRDRYFAALDKAHTTRTEVEDFARFLREEMSVDWSEADRKTPAESRTASP
jgi:Fic family protein